MIPKLFVILNWIDYHLLFLFEILHICTEPDRWVVSFSFIIETFEVDTIAQAPTMTNLPIHCNLMFAR
jgi:hypothetical protein